MKKEENKKDKRRENEVVGCKAEIGFYLLS